MRKNDLIELDITDMGVGGEGIGKCDGMVFFVKDAIIGDRVRARVVKLKKGYGYARLEELLRPSDRRCEPRCPLHRRCGGCQIQAMAPQAQLAFKEQKVRGNLIRLGGFAADFISGVMEPIVGMEEPYRYRNKAQFPIGADREGNPVAGFYAARTHSIIPVEDCLLGVEQNRDVLAAMLAYMREEHVSAYDEATGRGLLRHVLIRYGFATGELMVCLVVNGRALPAKERLLERLSVIDGMKSITLNVNEQQSNVILGGETFCLWGEPYITDEIRLLDCRGESFVHTDMAVRFQISPRSFYQVNPVQTEKLYSLALDYAGLTGTETVWDLYCGIGTISLFLAKRAGKVYGVEIVEQAVADAKRNAALNGITNAEFFVGKVEEVLPRFYADAAEEERRGRESQPPGGDVGKQSDGDVQPLSGRNPARDMAHPNVIVVDPPRKGCDRACLDTMLKMQPERIIYVSCDSATLARDLRVLVDGGYELKRVRAVDQFGQTVHVETVCLLSKLNVGQHIEVELQMDELDLTAAESKATYEEIKEYVLERAGLKVSNLYIAQVKRKCGIIERGNYNLPKSEDSRQPKCPLEKERAIREALEYFQMI